MASTPTEAQGWTEVLARCLCACVLPACTSPGAAPNLRAADLPFQCSTYLPAKACCLESTRLRPNKWIRKSHSPECQEHDVVGDGRCGYRALAHYLGVSCTSVMQRIAQIMAAAGACPAPELIQLLAACDLRAPCDRSAWLTSARLQLVVNFMSCNFPQGILVRLDHHSAGSPDWLWFHRCTAQPSPLTGRGVTALLAEGAQPCMLGHTQRPSPHFFLLSACGTRAKQEEIGSVQSCAGHTPPMPAFTGVLKSFQGERTDAPRSGHAFMSCPSAESCVRCSGKGGEAISGAQSCCDGQELICAQPVLCGGAVPSQSADISEGEVVGAPYTSSLLSVGPCVPTLRAAIGLHGGALLHSGGADAGGGPSLPASCQRYLGSLPWSVRVRVLQYATDACNSNTCLVARVSRQESQLLLQSVFWRGSSIVVPACSCRRLCVARAVRALWPSQSITSITWGFPPATSQLPGDDVLHLPIYAVRQVASARFVHAWLSLEEGPSLASLRLYASCLLRSAKVVQVRVGLYLSRRSAGSSGQHFSRSSHAG